MAANVLNSMGADVAPKTASDPLERLSYYGIPYPSIGFSSMYQASAGGMQSRLQSATPAMGNPLMSETITNPAMASTGMQMPGLQSPSYFPGAMMPDVRRFEADQMYPYGQKMTSSYGGYSPAIYGGQFSMAAKYPGYNPMMGMYGQGLYR